MTNEPVLVHQAILPFIETDQYIDFVDTCEYVRKYKWMALVFGYGGAGKTASALRYRPINPTRVLHFNLLLFPLISKGF